MYEERPSPATGGVAWQSVAAEGDTAHRVVPDGCIDVLWDGGRLVVAGPDTRSFLAPSRAGAVHLGIRFAPGAAPFILGVAADGLVDERVPLEQVWAGRLVRQLTDLIGSELEHRGPTAALATLERAMTASQRRSPSPDPWIATAVAQLDRGDAVAAVAAGVGYSERQFQRRSQQLFGYGPKLLARIRRFDRASTLAQTGTPLAQVAAAAGYADQAHLARDARALVGVPMTDFLRERASTQPILA